jgi:hypothetical protein
MVKVNSRHLWELNETIARCVKNSVSHIVTLIGAVALVFERFVKEFK